MSDKDLQLPTEKHIHADRLERSIEKGKELLRVEQAAKEKAFRNGVRCELDEAPEASKPHLMHQTEKGVEVHPYQAPNAYKVIQAPDDEAPPGRFPVVEELEEEREPKEVRRIYIFSPTRRLEIIGVIKETLMGGELIGGARLECEDGGVFIIHPGWMGVRLFYE